MRMNRSNESNPESNGFEMKQKEVSLDQLSIIDDSSGSADEGNALSDSGTVIKQETSQDDSTAVVIVT
jgi:hypothetical protein